MPTSHVLSLSLTGSLLGDKTRMPDLSRDMNVYIPCTVSLPHRFSAGRQDSYARLIPGHECLHHTYCLSLTGSLLGDKTRMPDLSRDMNVYIPRTVSLPHRFSAGRQDSYARLIPGHECLHPTYCLSPSQVLCWETRLVCQTYPGT